MFTLADIRREYDRLDELTGVDTKDIKLEISNRSCNRYGYCRYDKDKPEKIVISDFVLKDKDERIFWDTIRHEYVHAMLKLRFPNEKSHGHDKVFKAGCIEVGCEPSRCATVQSELAKKKREDRVKYIVYCPKCKSEWRYVKAGKVVKGLQKKRHLRCPYCTVDVKLKAL